MAIHFGGNWRGCRCARDGKPLMMRKMANSFPTVGTLSVLASLLTISLTPAARSVDRGPSVTTNATGPSDAMPETRRAPVPLVRKVPTTPRAPIAVFDAVPRSPPVEPTSGVEPPEPTAPERFDSKAAKMAVEADGYKRVTVLGKAGNGGWRAKAFRGTTEVLLTVDGTGTVSVE